MLSELECYKWLLHPKVNPKTLEEFISEEDFIQFSIDTVKLINHLDIYKLNPDMFYILGLDALYDVNLADDN